MLWCQAEEMVSRICPPARNITILSSLLQNVHTEFWKKPISEQLYQRVIQSPNFYFHAYY